MLTVAPSNPVRGLPRIQGVYILFDAQTLQPTRLIDGPALTISAPPRSPSRRRRMRCYVRMTRSMWSYTAPGLRPVRTLRDVLRDRRAIASVQAVVRNAETTDPGTDFTGVLRSGSEEAMAATSDAGLILCTTTARTPLFPGDRVRGDAVVIAVGSHEPDARELDSQLMGRSEVIVEDRGAALRECGDVVMALADGALARG